MPFQFACTHCGLETLVEDEFAGHSGPCAGCGKTITVPFLAPEQSAQFQPVAAVKNTRVVVLLSMAGIAAACGVFSILVWLVFPAFQAANRSIHSMSCRGNLQRIAQALRQYELDHGTLPPAFMPDAKGKPMHSWRVLILPQLGEQGLHQRYRFDEPWDGPNNSQLVMNMPSVFACPSDASARANGETNYMAIVGPGTLFPGKDGLASGMIRDASATTILLAETPTAGIVWMQPKDLDATRMKFSINSTVSGEIGSYHHRGANVVTLDGTARFLTDLFPDDYLKSMSTANGGDDVPLEVLP